MAADLGNAVETGLAERAGSPDQQVSGTPASRRRTLGRVYLPTFLVAGCAGRGLEISDQRERALGDAIAAETGVDTVEQRVVAAQLAAVHPVLFADGMRRSLAGQPRDEIREVLAAEAGRAFDLLEPSLGGYGIRARERA
jgi:hypothetical protein